MAVACNEIRVSGLVGTAGIGPFLWPISVPRQLELKFSPVVVGQGSQCDMVRSSVS